MGNTRHITIRMPELLVAAIDLRAEEEKRSRSQVVVLALEPEFGISGERVSDGNQDDDAGRSGSSESGAAKRKGKRTTVPVLQKTEGKAQRLHPVPAVRSELVERGGHLERPEGRAEGGDATHAGHRTFKNGDKNWCSTCGIEY